MKTGISIWSDKIQVGIEEIDNERQEIVTMLNRLNRRSGCEADVGDILEELIGFTIGHLRNEEKVLEECGYPDLEEHRGLHREFEIMAKSYLDLRNAERSLENLAKIRSFLKDWLYKHILNQDPRIAAKTETKQKRRAHA